MPTLGFTELVVILVIAIFYLVPIAAGIWAVITLYRVHTGQKSIQNRLEEIERFIRDSLPQQ